MKARHTIGKSIGWNAHRSFVVRASGWGRIQYKPTGGQIGARLRSALSIVVNAQADARPMYKQRPWQAVTNRRLKTESLVVRAL
ncbi:hypothetical protein KFO32_16620 [Pantoea ananatis]|uniref:hypothetical protein n=1 Tax=Pantoea ananas TaxID=553 RepID=UPI001FF689E8|nr:hypothetical protein [Pantoea ananatis]MCK0554666.1 hypothetical protein [Pantoea ananatis]